MSSAPACAKHGVALSPPDRDGDSRCPACAAEGAADPAWTKRLGQAMADHIGRSLRMPSASRAALGVEQLPPCPSCGNVAGKGAAGGCEECVAREVMDE